MDEFWEEADLNIISKDFSRVKMKSLSLKPNPVDTGRKLNVHKTFRRRPGRSEDVQKTSYVRSIYALCLRRIFTFGHHILGRTCNGVLLF